MKKQRTAPQVSNTSSGEVDGVLVQAGTVDGPMFTGTAGDQTFGDRITFNGAGGTYVQAGEQPVEIHHTFGDRPGRER